ncbi:centromere protein I-like [Prorops nasuta]|uniref:centromere protein I-like n=1 Tax=Prorops nasuta TaxID=863751 RepID=UPI0034D015DE
MEEERQKTLRKFLKQCKEKGNQFKEFNQSLPILQNFATTTGLPEDDFDLLLDVIIYSDLGALKRSALIKNLIPEQNISQNQTKTITVWFLSKVNTLPITVSMIVMQWLICVCDFRIADVETVNIFYDVFFFTMLKRERLQKYIAQLIYLLAKPEDVTRADVSRLLAVSQKNSKIQKHIIALLSLFKSYKPELVPEQIQSINIESVWRPIPDVLRSNLEKVKHRIEDQQRLDVKREYFKWDIVQRTKPRKNTVPLLPSVCYFQIGSSIFKDKNIKSIFEINSIDELGKYNLNVDLPCNATSLLANMAGYHLLTFADFQYQSRFSYNLYNTFRRACILEREKYSEEEIKQLFNMTAEFCRYMQQGVKVVDLFFNEYLDFNIGEFNLEFLNLLPWMTLISATDLQEKLLVHVKRIFLESSLEMKCEIIKSLRKFVANMFFSRNFDGTLNTLTTPFLGKTSVDNLETLVSILTNTCEKIIIAGLNIHSFDLCLLSEGIAYYEELNILQSIGDSVSWNVAPPAIIYGGLATSSCSILSRICSLLLKYYDLIQIRSDNSSECQGRNDMILLYIKDFMKSLWHNKSFNSQDEGYFLRTLGDSLRKDLSTCELDHYLNIKTHYSILPYIWVLNRSGIIVNTREDALQVAAIYYPVLSKFIDSFKDII